ncbi:MAG: hypothetical protein J5966_05935 [Lachnospiraceae bacterium]|nr:hypothetical protein [Lachnospiraceae bacterium]
MRIRIRKFLVGVMVLDMLYTGAGIDSIESLKTMIICMTPALLAMSGLIVVRFIETVQEMKAADIRKKMIVRRAARRKSWEEYLNSTKAA